MSVGTMKLSKEHRFSRGGWVARVFAATLSVTLAFVMPACSRVDEPQKGGAATEAKPALKKLAWTRAPKGDLATVVAAHMKTAESQGRLPLVYVGATWCEPCQHFHHAAEKGELDARFGDVSVLELDADADGSRLEKAGYASTYIPLFVIPGPDGRGSDRRMAGSIKGEGAVAEITPRLSKLLGR